MTCSKPVLRGAKAECILVVEDDADVRTYSCDTLSELGYDVLAAETGAAGLRLLDEHPGICVLFTDVGLPGGMNGRQLAEEARRRRPDLKVLFTTGYARNAIVHDGRLDAGVELITKPYTQAALAEKLRDIIDAKREPGRILLSRGRALDPDACRGISRRTGLHGLQGRLGNRGDEYARAASGRGRCGDR